MCSVRPRFIVSAKCVIQEHHWLNTVGIDTEMKTKKSSAHEVQSRPSEPGRIKIGDLMVREGLLSPDGLERALQHQKKSENYKPLGKVCVELKLISRQELQRFLRKHHQTMHLGDVLLNMGLISQKQLQHVLEQQRISSNRFGTLLVQSGIITEPQLVEALSIQLDLPRIMPAPELVDTSLLKGLDEMFFREHIFLPIQKQGRQVAVVIADPLDGELLQKLVNHVFTAQPESRRPAELPCTSEFSGPEAGAPTV